MVVLYLFLFYGGALLILAPWWCFTYSCSMVVLYLFLFLSGPSRILFLGGALLILVPWWCLTYLFWFHGDSFLIPVPWWCFPYSCSMVLFLFHGDALLILVPWWCFTYSCPMVVLSYSCSMVVYICVFKRHLREEALILLYIGWGGGGDKVLQVLIGSFSVNISFPCTYKFMYSMSTHCSVGNMYMKAPPLPYSIFLTLGKRKFHQHDKKLRNFSFFGTNNKISVEIIPEIESKSSD